MSDTLPTTNRIKWLIPVIWSVLLIIGFGTYWLNQPSVIKQNEASAIQSLKEICVGQVHFRESAPQRYLKPPHPYEGERIMQYAHSLQHLGPGKPDLIDAQLASGEKDGYVFEMTGGNSTYQYTYQVQAYPKSPGKTGNRYFLVDESGFIRFSDTFPTSALESTVIAEHKEGFAEYKAFLAELSGSQRWEDIEKLTTTEVPTINGIVTALDRKDRSPKIVTLSVGTNESVEKGFHFHVYRGNQFVGQVVVEEVFKNSSRCRVVFVKDGGKIMIGDNAATRL